MDRGYCPPPCYDTSRDGVVLCDDDMDNNTCIEENPCDFSVDYTTFEQVQALTGEDETCKLGHTLTVLLAIFNQARRNFTSIDNGYDSAFGHYADSVKERIQPSIDRLMNPDANKWGSKYFSCTWKGGSPQSCPIDATSRFSDSWELYLQLNDRAGFFAELNNTYGVLESWVRFDKTYSEAIDRSCTVTGGQAGCSPSTR